MREIGRDLKEVLLLFSSCDAFFLSCIQQEQHVDLSLCVALQLSVYCTHLSVMHVTLSLRCHWHWICRQQLVGKWLPSTWQHGLKIFDLKENSRRDGGRWSQCVNVFSFLLVLLICTICTFCLKIKYTIELLIYCFNNDSHILLYVNIWIHMLLHHQLKLLIIIF